ncbi:MAG TPA: hemin uptake protein HemP [Chromatiales bacterium]|nr:hemin uptake protein HemP [Thiotrichales bacterium]HIP67789.1 hemin uptake protein HemP [Chromatiales bacterium]
MSQILKTEQSTRIEKSRQFRPALDVNILMRGQQELLLRHDGRHYQLQVTRKGGLILTGYEQDLNSKENKEITKGR